MKNEKDVLILAIESSCDETAAAVVKNGRTVLSNVINTQIAIHTEYGGVVPEIASRKHIENINPVIREALKEADVRSGTFAVDARSLMGIFSLNLNKPVEVWFKTEVTEQTKTMDMDKYFAAKIEKWLIHDIGE